jgi:hypothetical protein
VEGGQLRERGNLFLDLIRDHCGLLEEAAPVHHTVSHGSDFLASQLLECSGILKAARTKVLGLNRRVIRIQQTQLDAARSRIEHEHAHGRAPSRARSSR